MALVKGGSRLGVLELILADGIVTDLIVRVNYQIKDDVTNVVEVDGQAKNVSLWGALSSTQKTAIQNLADRINQVIPTLV